MVNFDKTLDVLIVKSCEIHYEITLNSTFWLATINPTKTLGLHRVRSIPGLCLTKGPRTAVLPAAESAVQSAGHVASRRGSACGRRNRGRRAWRAGGATLFKSPVGMPRKSTWFTIFHNKLARAQVVQSNKNEFNKDFAPWQTRSWIKIERHITVTPSCLL